MVDLAVVEPEVFFATLEVVVRVVEDSLATLEVLVRLVEVVSAAAEIQSSARWSRAVTRSLVGCPG
ncbi:MAG: hypothetical protein ACLP50_22455 [Solirubrobacteraceae bacterium]